MDIKAAYKKLKADHPEAYTALAILPVSGQLAAIADYAEAMDDGDSVKMALAAGSMIPGVKLAKMGKVMMGVKVSPPSFRVGMSAAEKALAPVVKHSPAIGKAFAVEQGAEYAGGKLIKEAAAAEDKDRQEYLQAWNEQPHTSFRISGQDKDRKEYSDAWEAM